MLPGWSRDKKSGKAERYISPSGESVSRRQYENERARQAGFKSWSHYQRIAGSRREGSRRYQKFADIYSEENDIPLWKVTGPRSIFTRAYIETDFNDRNANGSFARFLEIIGIRKPNAKYPVGATPSAHQYGGFRG